MTAKRGLLAVVGCLIAVPFGLLWWPQEISGRVVDGVSGEPIKGARIATTGVIYKPLAPLHAFAWGNATSSTTRLARTDREGRFGATFLAGVRLKHAILRMTKRGFVISPVIEGGSGTRNLYAEDLASSPTFPAWTISSSTEMEMDGGYERVLADGNEHQVQFGRAHAFWIRADARNRMSDEDPIAVSIRWVSARIQETGTFALIAPQDGYQRVWHGTVDCTSRELTPRHFAIRTGGGFFGAFSIEMQGLCIGIGEISISYRFSEEIGVRTLANEEELKLATRHDF